MASLSSLYLKKDVLDVLVKTLNSKGEKGVNLTVSINDESDNYGQNVSAYVSQSKEDREAGKKRFYVGNGNVFWTDGNIVRAEKQAPTQKAQPVQEDLPF
jgi:hypothetical protein